MFTSRSCCQDTCFVASDVMFSPSLHSLKALSLCTQDLGLVSAIRLRIWQKQSYCGCKYRHTFFPNEMLAIPGLLAWCDRNAACTITGRDWLHSNKDEELMIACCLVKRVGGSQRSPLLFIMKGPLLSQPLFRSVNNLHLTKSNCGPAVQSCRL